MQGMRKHKNTRDVINLGPQSRGKSRRTECCFSSRAYRIHTGLSKNGISTKNADCRDESRFCQILAKLQAGPGQQTLPVSGAGNHL